MVSPPKALLTKGAEVLAKCCAELLLNFYALKIWISRPSNVRSVFTLVAAKF